MKNFDKKYSLREKKYAKTKIALTNAFIERLKKTRFNDISIKEICESTEVSEATFYNYFPQKIDVVSYFKQIIGLKISCEIRKNAKRLNPQKLIEFTFDCIAKEMEQPYLFYEMISLFTAEKKKPKEMELTSAEKFYAYPAYEGVTDIPAEPLEEIFLSLVKEAKKKGEFKKEIKPEDVSLTLLAIMVGIPLAIDIEKFGKIKEYYRSQLSLLWSAVGTH
ncbi:MAG TPA: TetR/AcrR family transcriptional regulator [Candidatus Omnitrophota bacterium]|nr:TetR/AcrR family transcriptional regulator [Candidatus Omnitrophota bacterium]